MSAAAAVSAVQEETPLYKELDYFEEADRSIFAGRQREIAQVVARISTQRCLVLYGRSGLGKTSLLKAGVFPILSERGMLPIYVRTLASPTLDLRNAILAAAKLTESDEDVAQLLRRIGEETLPVIVLDQFEEFFIRFGPVPVARAQFISHLTSLIKDISCEFRLVFSLREEYLAALDGFQKELPELFHEALRLGPLTAFAAREAIVAPLIRHKITYDERLIDKLVDELAVFDFDSARLQITCAELCQAALTRHERLRHLSLEDFQRLEQELSVHAIDANEQLEPGTPVDSSRNSVLRSVFRCYLTRKIADVQAQSPTLTRLILEVMITRAQTKYAISWTELTAYDFDAEDAVRGVLTSLERGKLIRCGERDKETWYELRHECLVAEIQHWLAKDEGFRNFQRIRSLLQASTENYLTDPKSLLSAQLMQRVIPHRLRLGSTEKQCEFLFVSAVEAGMSDEAAYWAGKYGRTKARELLANGLRLPTPSAAALTVARSFADDPGTLPAQALSIALDVMQPAAVRTAAGETFAALASQLERKAFASQLPILRVPTAQREVMADLVDVDKTEELSRLARLRARRYASRRKAQRYLKEASGSWTFPPWMTAMFAALAWVPLSALPVVALMLIYFFNDEIETWATAGGYLLLGGAVCTAIAAVVGPFMGWRITRAGAATVARNGPARWEKTRLPWIAASFLLSIAPLVGMLFWISESFWAEMTGDSTYDLLIILVGTVLVVVALRALTHIVIRVAVARTLVSRQLWRGMIVPAVCAHTFLVLLPLVTLYAFDALWRNDFPVDLLRPICVALFLALAVTSLLATVAGATLAQYAPASQKRLARAPNRIEIGVLLACSLLGLSFFVFNPGFSKLTATPRAADLADRQADGSTRVESEFTHWPQTHRWTIQASTDPALVQLESGFMFDLQMPEQHALSFGRRTVYFAPDGVVRFFSSNNSYSQEDSRAEVLFVPIKTPPCSGSREIATEGALYLCQMTANENGGWSLHFTGTLATPSPMIQIDVAMGTDAEFGLRELRILGGVETHGVRMALRSDGMLVRAKGIGSAAGSECIELPEHDRVALEFVVSDVLPHVAAAPHIAFSVSLPGSEFESILLAPCRSKVLPGYKR